MMILFTFDAGKALLWKRLVAQVIDCALVMASVFALIIVVRPLKPFSPWILFLSYLAYAVLMDAYKDGTIGKLYMGLRIVRNEQGSSRLIGSIYRNVTKLIVAFFLYDVLLLILRKGYSGIHNRIAKTVIVERSS